MNRLLLIVASLLIFGTMAEAAVTILPVIQGGTGWASLESTRILIGNGSSQIATSSSSITSTGVVGLASSSPTSLFGISLGTSTVIQAAQFIQTTASSSAQAATYTVDWETGNYQRFILNQATNIVINATSSNPREGGRYVLELCQDATGGRVATFVTPGQLRWGGVTPATTTIDVTANECTFIGFVFRKSSNVYNAVASSTNNARN